MTAVLLLLLLLAVAGIFGKGVLWFQAFPVAHLILWARARAEGLAPWRRRAWPALLVAWLCVQGTAFLLRNGRLEGHKATSLDDVGYWIVRVLPSLAMAAFVSHVLAYVYLKPTKDPQFSHVKTAIFLLLHAVFAGLVASGFWWAIKKY